MRKRSRILDDLEALYREAFERAEEAGDDEAMGRLDFEFRREQLYLEVLLDMRALLAGVEGGISTLATPEGASEDAVSGAEAFLERAAKIRRLTKLR